MSRPVQVAKTKFRHRLISAIALPIVLMTLLAVILFWQLNNLLSVTRWVEHTDQVISKANYTQKLLVDMETGMRGYILSNDPVFLEPYQKSNLLINDAFNDLENLVADNPSQRQHLKELQTTYQQWNSYAAAMVAFKRSTGGYQLSVIKARKQLMDQIRYQADTFIETEELLRSIRSKKAQKTTDIVLASCTGIAFLIGCLLSLFSKHQLIEVSKNYSHAFKIVENQLEDIRESEERFRLFVEGVKDYSIFMMDTKGHISTWNIGAERIKGYQAKEIIGQYFSILFTPEDLANGLPEQELQIAATEGEYKGEGWRKRKDGSLFFANVLLTALKDATGNLKGFSKITRDITERRQAEQDLKESEERFRAIFEQAAVGIAHVALDGKWLMVNQKLCDIVGYTRAELLDLTFQDITYDEELNTDLEYVQQVLANQIQAYSMEKRYIRKDNTLVWIKLTVSLVREPSGEPQYFISVIEDISEAKRDEAIRKQIEAKLEETNQKLQAMIQASPLAIVIINKLGKVEFWSSAAEKIFGWREQEVLNQPMPIVATDQQHESQDNIKNSFNGRLLKGIEVKSQKKDGTQIDINIWSAPLHNVDGNISSLLAVMADITTRKQGELALRRAIERLATVHEIDLAILCARSAEEIVRAALLRLSNLVSFQEIFVVWFNFTKGEARMLKATIDDNIEIAEVTTLELDKFIPAYLLGKAPPSYSDYLEAIDREPQFSELNPILKIENGITFHLVSQGELFGEFHLIPKEVLDISIENRQIVYEIISQIAIAIQQLQLREQLELKAAELEQRVIERTTALQAANAELEAFVYSVSHDLRAPLRNMQGFCLALLEDYPQAIDSDAPDYARRILNAAQRMDILIEDLLTYSRISRSELKLTAVDLNFVVAEALKTLESEINEKQALITVAEPLPRVLGHRSTLAAIITNLLGNAMKFVARGVQPQVLVWTEIVRVEEDKGDKGDLIQTPESKSQNQEWVRLWVEDNGIGIDQEDRDRIFRVFERLHGIESYPGTGIGLAIVSKGIERMGGRVGVESTVNVGSRFWIELSYPPI